MLNEISLKNILESFAGLPATLILAGITWLFKISYDKHRKEIFSIATLERTYAQNLRVVDDNRGFLDQWLEAVKNKAFYYVYFEELVIDSSGYFALSDMKLVNLILRTNYYQRRANVDLKNLYDSYIEAKKNFAERKIIGQDFEQIIESVMRTIPGLKAQLDFIKPEVIKAIAYLQLSGRVRKYSLFGCLGLLNVDIFPRVTQKKLDQKIKSINANYEPR